MCDALMTQMDLMAAEVQPLDLDLFNVKQREVSCPTPSSIGDGTEGDQQAPKRSRRMTSTSGSRSGAGSGDEVEGEDLILHQESCQRGPLSRRLATAVRLFTAIFSPRALGIPFMPEASGDEHVDHLARLITALSDAELVSLLYTVSASSPHLIAQLFSVSAEGPDAAAPTAVTALAASSAPAVGSVINKIDQPDCQVCLLTPLVAFLITSRLEQMEAGSAAGEDGSHEVPTLSALYEVFYGATGSADKVRRQGGQTSLRLSAIF